jgi:hypothetical protein
MTATVQVNGDVATYGDAHDLLPTSILRPLAASEQIGKGQLVTINPSTGYARLNDGSVPNQIGGGVGVFSEKSNTSATAGLAQAALGQQAFKHFPMSTTANDSFTDADFWTPFYIADENTIGKLSYTGTRATTLVNRSLGGMFLGLDPVTGLANVWVGPIAYEVARAAVAQTGHSTGGVFKGIDTAAATDTFPGLIGATASEIVIPRDRQHGTVQAIYFTTEGTTLAASGATDYGQLNVSKRDGAGGTATVIATMTTKTVACTQFTSRAFTLDSTAGYCDLLDTDILTLTRTHGGTGAIIPAGYVRVIERVG